MLSTPLATPRFDSANLFGMASIAHPIREPGRYQISVLQGRGFPLWRKDLVVRDGGKARVTIDLSQHPSIQSDQTEPVLAPAGMLNLQAPGVRQGSYALLTRSHSRGTGWDSRALEQGDYYACMPLRPGIYDVINGLGRAGSVLRVNYPDPRAIAAGQRLATEPVQLEVGSGIAPSEVCIDPGQVLVFSIVGNARVIVELASADDGPPDLADWRVARAKEVLAGLGYENGSVQPR